MMSAQGNMWLKVWGALLIVFALGCVTGIAIDGIYRSRASNNLPASIRDGDAYFERLKRELDLNSEQATAMRAILEQTRGEYKAICAEVRPRYDVLRERARERMRALLSAEQQQNFDSMIMQEDCNTCPDRRK